jgi:hypothetical protein
MEFFYLFLFAFLLFICALQDNKNRLVSPYPIIGMWVVALLSSVNLFCVVISFVFVWFILEILAQKKIFLLSFGDVLGLPPFVGFMLYFNQNLGNFVFAIPLIFVVFFSFRTRDKNGMRPMYVDLFLLYLFWLLILLGSQYISFS